MSTIEIQINGKDGIYETIYGNGCIFEEGSLIAWDIDMGEEIPVEMVDFSKFIREEL